LIGLLAGLLAVGGGIEAVPVLLDVFSIMGLSPANAVVLPPSAAERSAHPYCRASPARSSGRSAPARCSPGHLRPAMLFFLTADFGTPGRTVDALGDVALFCVAALSLPALFVAPIAARWPARAPVSLLRRLFAPCFAAIVIRLLLQN
jgi:uncharacterized membrane protein YfcA